MAIGPNGVGLIRRANAYRAVVVFTILALFGLAGLGYYVFRTNLDALQQLNRENLAWSSNQLQLELNRFRREMAELRAGSEGASTSSVNNRFDILWSRVALSEEGSLGERLRAYDQETRVLAGLQTSLQETEQAIVGLKSDDLATLDRLIERYRGHELPMRDFSRAVYFGEDAQIARVRDNLRTSSLFTAAVTLIAFVVSGLALAIVSKESAFNLEMAAKNLSLAKDAEAANETKSRFLTMMSHELRTPMNGVLGMLALAKQRGLPPAQLRIVEQAEKSGRQMISMLSDILDYSALQDETMELDRKPFEPRKLAEAIEELFGAVARREGIDFNVSCEAECPHRLEGDFRRLRQTVAHFASYIVETAGTSNVDIALSHSSGVLKVQVSFEYGAGMDASEGWQPEILLGQRIDGVDQFASDALGPAVARGILARLGGTVWLDYSDDGRIAIILTAPAPEVEIKDLMVRIEAQSESLKAICRMALSGEKVVFYEEGSPAQVHVVLFEAGGANEVSRLNDIRHEHKNALMVALGKPITPADFDDQVGIPLNVNEVRAAVVHSIALDRAETASQA